VEAHFQEYAQSDSHPMPALLEIYLLSIGDKISTDRTKYQVHFSAWPPEADGGLVTEHLYGLVPAAWFLPP
jgi:hypothetical protein